MSHGGAPRWEPVHRPRAHELVIEAIEEQILAGALSVGDSLPPERELAAQLQVSRAGVREAVRVLEHMGILRSRAGAGPGSGTSVTSLPGEGLTQLLRLHVALANFEIADVVEARVTLERSSARLAAAASDPTRLAPIREALARMGENVQERENFNDADSDFHIAVAQAGGNELVASLTTAIRGSLRGRILGAIRAEEDWEAVAAQLMQEHGEILAAIEAGDAERAAQLSERHIRHAAATLHGVAGA